MHDRRIDAWVMTPEQRKEYFSNTEYFQRIQEIINGRASVAEALYEVCRVRREQAEQLSVALGHRAPAPIVIHVQDSPELRDILLRPKAPPPPTCLQRHGWDLFNVGLDNEGVQRVDEAAVFCDDMTAMEHVLGCRSCFESYKTMKWKEG